MTMTPAYLSAEGVKGKAAPRNEICAVPRCGDASAHGHHIYPRSHLRGQPYEWVRLSDDRVISNTIGLCFMHHDWVTGSPYHGHRARLDWQDGALWWIRLQDVPPHVEYVGPLDPQPLSGEVEAGAEAPASPRPQHQHPHLAPGETCEACGYTRPVPREPGPKRRALTWGVSVPADVELGAEVLDDW